MLFVCFVVGAAVVVVALVCFVVGVVVAVVVW